MTDLMENRNILLGITGSIAAFKSAELIRILTGRGYTVRCVMTDSAQQFITPVTLQTLTGNPVITSFWERTDPGSIDHVSLADWANIVMVAPATADLIAKMVMGVADSPLHAMLLATRAPILLAPAMNTRMLEHPATQENIEILRSRGVNFVFGEDGALACGWTGAGRFADPWEIFFNARRLLSRGDFAGKRVLITAGPTREAIDPVRFISNRSSGKMGIALAQEAFCRGAEVTLVHGPVTIKTPGLFRSIPVSSATEMHEAVINLAFGESEAFDVVIMNAAVSDYRPAQCASRKMKKEQMETSLQLVPNPDILADLGRRRKGRRPVLVGFAVETGEIDQLLEEVREKLRSKNADLMIGNFASEAIELDTNRVWMVDRSGRQEEVATSFKSRVANRILDSVLRL